VRVLQGAETPENPELKGFDVKKISILKVQKLKTTSVALYDWWECLGGRPA
jgi:hypothetical protein